MATTISSVCHLKETSETRETWPLMGLTPMQVWEKMSHHLETIEYKCAFGDSWTVATREYEKCNDGHKTYMDLPGSKQQSRDSELLMKRYDLMSKVLFNGLFPPGTLNIYFVLAGTPEWIENRKGLCLEGYAASNRREPNTVPSSFAAIVLIYERPRIRCNTKRMKLMTGNLLHEVVHAILEAYACACQSCQSNILDGEGFTGHGPVWLAISRRIEQTMLQIFGYRCWLGRSQSLAHEHHVCRYIHSPQELKVLEVNEKLYCEARLDFGRNELASSNAFLEADFTYLDDGKQEDMATESDFSEDDTEYSSSGSDIDQT